MGVLLTYKVNSDLFNPTHSQWHVTEMELGFKPLVFKLLPQYHAAFREEWANAIKKIIIVIVIKKGECSVMLNISIKQQNRPTYKDVVFEGQLFV